MRALYLSSKSMLDLISGSLLRGYVTQKEASCFLPWGECGFATERWEGVFGDYGALTKLA